MEHDIWGTFMQQGGLRTPRHASSFLSFNDFGLKRVEVTLTLELNVFYIGLVFIFRERVEKTLASRIMSVDTSFWHPNFYNYRVSHILMHLRCPFRMIQDFENHQRYNYHNEILKLGIHIATTIQNYQISI